MIVYGWGGAYNKRDFDYRWGTCDGCGHVGYLSSYTFTKFFSVYWFPLLPHGSQRAIDSCPSCKKGRALSLRQYKKLRRTELVEAMDSYERAPSDVDAASRVLDAINSFGEGEELARVVPLLTREFAANAQILARTGWTLSRFDMRDEGAQLLERSLTIEDDSEVRALLESTRTQAESRAPSPPNRLFQLLPILLLPALITAVILAFLVASAASGPRNAFLVNGLPADYPVLVNGQQVIAMAGRPTRLDVPFGTLRLEAAPGGMPIDVAEFELEADFTSRTSSKLVFIINPDRTALLGKHRLVYTSSTVPPVDGSEEYLVGKTFYAFTDIDFPFETPPDTVSLSSRNHEADRHHLEHLSDVTPYNIYGFIYETDGPDHANDYLKSVLRFDTSQDELLQIAFALLEASDLRELLQPGLAERPVLVEWHRTYHQVVKRDQPDHDLVTEYRELLKKDPENCSLMYLLGRLVEDTEESHRLFERAIAGPNPEPFGHFALSYARSEQADYETALKHVEEAMRLAPGNSTFADFHQNMLIGTRSWDSLTEILRDELVAAPLYEDKVLLLYGVLNAAGNDAAARSVEAEYLKQLRAGPLSDDTDEMISETADKFRATRALWADDTKGYVASARKVSDPDWKLRVALARSDVHACGRILRMEDGSARGMGYAYLGLYALAVAIGDTAAADRELKQAVELLSRGTKDEKTIASWFSDKAPDSHEDTLVVSLGVPLRRIVDSALAMRYPQAAQPYIESARRLNVHRDNWYLPIRKITGVK